MEAANRGASEAEGITVGLGISLPHEQANNEYITRELSLEFHYFFMRKFWFAYMAKAVVFFPGGFGTLDELFEILTLLQTGKIRKHLPIVLFDRSFWESVVNFQTLINHGTISEDDPALFLLTVCARALRRERARRHFIGNGRSQRWPCRTLLTAGIAQVKSQNLACPVLDEPLFHKAHRLVHDCKFLTLLSGDQGHQLVDPFYISGASGQRAGSR